MASTRLLQSSTSLYKSLPSSSPLISRTCEIKCNLKNGGSRLSGESEKRSSVAVKASIETIVKSNPQTNPLTDLAALVASVSNVLLRSLKNVRKMKQKRFHVQMFIESTIINCRFFTFFAVGGSLLGSVLCFIEGCFMIVESYLQYFHSFSTRSNQDHVIHLLIEAIDMFMVGTALLVFGMSLYVMFVKSTPSKERSLWLPRSNLFGIFYFKALPAWVEMQSVSQAKSKIGHAVMMILQVGVLEKFKNVPLVTSLDLACFACSVLLSSASIFVLSKLSCHGKIVKV